MSFVELYTYSSLLTLLLVFLFDRERLTIDYGAIAMFVGFMVLMTFLRMSFIDIEDINTHGFKISNFLFVGLEDVFYMAIPFYICKFINIRFIKFFIWVGFSLLFGYGHLYQGLFAASIISLYPFFVSRKYMERVGLLTVMCCHYIYDCMTLLGQKMQILLSFV